MSKRKTINYNEVMDPQRRVTVDAMNRHWAEIHKPGFPEPAPFVFLSADDTPMTKDYCDVLIEDFQENGQFMEARVGPGVKTYNTRDVSIWCHENEKHNYRLKKLIWLANRQRYNYRLFDIEVPQLCVYYEQFKSHYLWHKDSSAVQHPEVGNRCLSMSILLNDPSEFEGGDLELFCGLHSDGSPIKVQVPFKQAGDAVVFPSDMYHRVRPVTKGTRAAMIVWCWGTYQSIMI